MAYELLRSITERTVKYRRRPAKSPSEKRLNMYLHLACLLQRLQNISS